MLLEAIEHRPKGNWASAIGPGTVELRLRTKRDDVREVSVLAGDKFAWDRTATLQPMRKFASDALFDYWQAFVTPPFRRLCYAFRIGDGQTAVWMTERGFSADGPENQMNLFEFPFVNPCDIFEPPAWVKDAVFYQIFPERFANGDPSNDPEGTEPWGGEPTPSNFFGGDLQGVIDHLDHLSELGVTAIYFTPVFEAPSNHKYDTRDYLKVDPHFGTNGKLKELVDACHARGIRVLLDAVFNHAGRTFEPFRDCLEKGEASRYANWFHVREWPLAVKDGIPTFDTFAFTDHMPKLNTENPEVQEYLLGVARYWIEEIGIDGWRLDVANEVDHRFWRRFRDTVKAANPDAYILGEVWHDALPWLQGDQFDAVMNYPFTTAVLDFFVERTLDAKGFADRLGRLIAAYPTRATEVAFNLLGSHDTPRLLTRCGGNTELMKLAVLVQFTFFGAPCVYYGDEIGLTGDHDPGCRKCMEWDPARQNRDLLEFYRWLIALRRGAGPLRTGDFRVLRAEAGEQVIAYTRASGDEQYAIVLNNQDKSALVRIALGEGAWTDVRTGAAVDTADGHAEVNLEPFGFRIWHAAGR